MNKNMTQHEKTYKLALAGLMAALCYAGYAFLPAFSADGTKIHFGNTFVVLAAYLLGGLYGGLAGAVGLTAADLLGGFAESAPRTFICKLMIGLIVGLVAHRVARISEKHPAGYVTKWAILAAAAGLGFNCIFEPSLKYIWYTILTPNPEKAAKAIASLMALTTYTTFINSIINTITSVVLYTALRPALKNSGLLTMLAPKPVRKKAKED